MIRIPLLFSFIFGSFNFSKNIARFRQSFPPCPFKIRSTHIFVRESTNELLRVIEKAFERTSTKNDCETLTEIALVKKNKLKVERDKQNSTHIFYKVPKRECVEKELTGIRFEFSV